MCRRVDWNARVICTIRADHLLSAYANNKGVTSSTKEQHTKCTTHHQASRQNPSIPNKIHGWTTRPENTLGDSYGSHDSWIFHTIPRDRTKRQNPPWPERLSSGEKSLLNNIYGSTPRPYDSWIQQTTRALGAYDSWKHYRSLHYPYGSTSLFYNSLRSVILDNPRQTCE